MNLPQHIEEKFEYELPEELFMHDNCECWNEPGELKCYQHNQKHVKSFIAQILEEEKERLVGEIVDKMNEYRMRECPMKGRMSQCTKDMCFHWTPSWQDIINLIKK